MRPAAAGVVAGWGSTGVLGYAGACLGHDSGWTEAVVIGGRGRGVRGDLVTGWGVVGAQPGGKDPPLGSSWGESVNGGWGFSAEVTGTGGGLGAGAPPGGVRVGVSWGDV